MTLISPTMETTSKSMREIDLSRPLWDSFFIPAPLVIVGSREGNGYDLAPKHMALPLGWDPFFGFVCAPTHGTYRNIEREGVFTVSFPTPDQVVTASLSATSRRETGGKKPVLQYLSTFRANKVDGVLVSDAAIGFECELDRIVDGFGPNSLIAGRIVAAYAADGMLRTSDTDDQEIIFQSPLLVYLHPGRYAAIKESYTFPFPTSYER